MPELPEVETVCATLRPLICGKTIQRVMVFRDKNILTGVEDFVSHLPSRTFIDVRRRGKRLIFLLDDGSVILSSLRMEGKYFFFAERAERAKHDIVSFSFTDGSELVYNDTRKFGTLERFASLPEAESKSSLAALGPEPFTLDAEAFFASLQKHSEPIKTALLDQTLIAGIGNIYDNEALFAAKIHPLSPANSLSFEEAKILLEAIQDILRAAIAEGGSTVKSYHPSQGIDGSFQLRLNVYGKTQQPCPRCGFPISRTEVSGRGTFFCPRCQRSHERPFLLGVTGPIHSGKNTVADYFASKGYRVFDADKEVWRLYQDRAVQQGLVRLLGRKAVIRGQINAAYIREALSRYPEKKKKLEEFLDPLLVTEARRLIDSTPAKDSILFNIPRLFDSSFASSCDAVILVIATPENRAKRLYDEGRDVDGLMRLNRAFPLGYARKNANFVIENDGTKKELFALLSALPLP